MKRLALSLIAIVLLAVIGLSWVMTELYFRLDNGSDYDRQIAPYLSASALLKNKLLSLPLAQQQQLLNSGHQGPSMQLQSALQFPAAALLNQDSEDALVLEAQDELSFHYYLAESQQVLSIYWPYQEVEQTQGAQAALTAVFYFGIISIVLLWLYPLMLRLRELSRSAKAFGQGDLSRRIERSRFRHIDAIEREFNAMADRIQQLIDDNKLLSRAVSHDLKTPLARLQFGIDMLAETKDEEKRQLYIHRLDKDIEEMEGLVSTLLQFARLDESQAELNQQKINVAGLVQNSVAQNHHAQELIKLELPQQDVSTLGDNKLFSMMFNNVLSNALNYAQTQVLVRLIVNEAGFDLVIEDDGPGFNHAETEQVLKPFMRGENSGKKRGHGMGLAIVHRIVQRFGAQLSLDQSPTLGGAKVIISFLY